MTVNPNHNSTYAADTRGALWERWMALRNGDLAQADTLVAPALALHLPALGRAADRPGGRSALISWISALRAAFPEGRLAVQVGPIISGDLIAGRWAFATEAATFTGTDIIRLAAGRVVEFWVNHDVIGEALPLPEHGTLCAQT
ncbi:nuclear transport factor 2 family protein [Micromonospora sp. CPCC 206061]|uniref:nuclear transport factor 2 family protein n=1 Tax=Micromonospora sp. CPCC 206061 TaxID=3122410 RepID=UPI002FEF3D3A